jgi:RHS repeat-associated protein
MADEQGTVTDVLDTSGTLVQGERYDAFGNLLASLASPSPLPDPINSLWGFTGRQEDLVTGLQNNRQRWYDPKIGRFISPDPSGIASDVNLYRYTGNDPLDRTDPSGLRSRGHFISDTGGYGRSRGRYHAHYHSPYYEGPIVIPDLAPEEFSFETGGFIGERNIVQIRLTGSYTNDADAANAAANLERRPSGYIWHHLDDYNPISGLATLQLVEEGAHEATRATHTSCSSLIICWTTRLPTACSLVR